MNSKSFILAASVAICALSAAPSYAQEGCSCVSADQQGPAVGQFTSAEGNVMASGTQGYVPAASGMPIALGSEISVGANSSAAIAVGSCRLGLGANSITRISRLTEGNICVASADTAPAPMPVKTSLPWGPIVIGTAAGGGLIALIVGQGDDPVSK